MTLSFFLIILIILFMFISRISILSPVGIQNCMWLFFIAGALSFLSKSYSFSFAGINWILSYCLLNTIMYSILSSRLAWRNSTIKYLHVIGIPWHLLFFFIVMSFLSFVITLVSNGVSINSLTNLSSLQNTSHSMAVQHYSEIDSNSIGLKFLNTFLYVSPLCAGFSLPFARSKSKKILCISSIIPNIMLVILTTAKLGIIAYVILFFVGFLSSYLSINNKVPEINAKIFVYIIVGFIAFLCFIYFSFWLRIGSTDKSIFNVIITKIGIYAFGHIQGFDVWLKNFNYDEMPGFGVKTFLAISSRIFNSVRQAGVYGILHGSCTNVYTQFRPLIEDFTPIIGLIILLLVNGLTSYAYLCIKNGINSIGTIFFFSFNMFYFLYFIISAWTYSSYILTFAFFYIFLLFTYKIKVIGIKEMKLRL